MKMSSTTKKILAAALVAGGVLYIATCNAKASASGKKMSSTSTSQPPVFPEANVSTEKYWVDQVFGEWAGGDLTVSDDDDMAAIKAGTLTRNTLVGTLANSAFVENYPTAVYSGEPPAHWKSSPEWSKWIAAGDRMYDAMGYQIDPILSAAGV
jgi:hypothetical protein